MSGVVRADPAELRSHDSRQHNSRRQQKPDVRQAAIQHESCQQRIVDPPSFTPGQGGDKNSS